jgi:hypothetical protein
MQPLKSLRGTLGSRIRPYGFYTGKLPIPQPVNFPISQFRVKRFLVNAKFTTTLRNKQRKRSRKPFAHFTKHGATRRSHPSSSACSATTTTSASLYKCRCQYGDQHTTEQYTSCATGTASQSTTSPTSPTSSSAHTTSATSTSTPSH